MRRQLRATIKDARSSSKPASLNSVPRSFSTGLYLQAKRQTPAEPPPPPPPPSPSPASPYASNQHQQQPSSRGAIANLAAQLRNTSALRSTTEPYVAYGGTEELFLECSRQCNYTIPSALAEPPTEPPTTPSGEELGEGTGWWLEPKSRGGLGLPVTFNAWAQVVFLHMWMLTVRLRCFPEKYVRNWHQNLLDHFFYAAEDRMATWHRMSGRGERNKNLKELWTQWRGVQLSYDEGLIKGDAVLAAAIWRNVFKGDAGVDISDLAAVEGYVMRELRGLGMMGDEDVAMGKIRFGDPREIKVEEKEIGWAAKPVAVGGRDAQVAAKKTA